MMPAGRIECLMTAPYAAPSDAVPAQTPAAASDSLVAHSFILTADDEHRIHVHAWPVAEPRAIVHISHGMAEHAGRYARLAKALNTAGYAVYAHDHRGHGLSVGNDEQMGHYADQNGWLKVLGDVDQVRNQLMQRHAGVPYVLLGHSMGSFIATAYALRHPQHLSGLILSGSNAESMLMLKVARLIALLERWRQGPVACSPLIAWLSFGNFNREFNPVRTAFDWLSRDAAEVDRYIADPLCGSRCSNQLWLDLLQGLLTINSPGALRQLPDNLPVWLFSGDRDPVGKNGKGVKKLAQRLLDSGCRKVKLSLYPQGRHEMLNESNREQVTRDLLEWLKQLPA